MDRDEMIEKILAQEKKDMDKMSKADVLGMWADYTDPDDDEYDMVEAMTKPQIVEAYLFAYRHGLEGNVEEELEDRMFNWESYDKPKYKTMMAYGDGMAMPLIISMDTSGSTMAKYKEGVFDFDTINAQYRKVAVSAIDSLSPSEVVIFDHNMTVEQVFAGNQYDAVQFIRDKDNLQPRNGTAKMSAVLEKVSGLFGNKLILTDAQFSSKSAEEPVVQEPDWIPDGDGRAVGQQDFAINMSPLHAEETPSLFDDWENLTEDERIQLLHDAGYPEVSGDSYTVAYAVHSKDTGEEIDDGEITVMASSPMEAKNEAMRMLEEGGLDDEEYELHTPRKEAESRFDKLSKEIAEEYEEKGKSPEEAERIGDATAAMIGRKKYGKTGMMKMQKKGMKADMVGSPSPTFNEDITGQDGPSAEPTNAVFEAMRTLAPSSRDVESARRDLKNSGYGDVIYDRYMVNRDGSSNKFYYTAVTEKDGKYYPMGAYGRIGYLSKLFNIYGKKENPRASMGSFEQAYRQCRAKENAKIKRNYVDFTLQMAEEFRAYGDDISSRQEWMIKKLGGTPKKSMTRSDASDYIKELQGKESGTWSAETLAEIEGPTAEATTGGLHSPSSFTIGWEDGAGYSSASLPPNEIAWAEEVKGAETKIFGIGLGTLALGALGIFGVKKLMDSKKDDTASGSDTKNAEKGCGCAKTVKKSVSVKESEYSVNQINPVEVEGQNDIHNAESVKLATPYSGPQTAHRQNNRPVRNLW